MVASGKKLLVLDINGLLIDTYYQQEQRPDCPHDAKVNRFYVYKRPFCKEFIEFCLENFIVGVWSSAREHNVYSLVQYMFDEKQEKLAFIWHQEHCTNTGFNHPEKKHKPVFLKELCKLWDKDDPDLPWETRDYGPSNTLLIDDSSYKAVKNPPHTAIFPKTYKATNPEDNYLEEELRIYLEGLLQAEDVQAYVEKNPIGEPSIVLGDLPWSKIFNAVVNGECKPPIQAQLEARCQSVASDSILYSGPFRGNLSSSSYQGPGHNQAQTAEIANSYTIPLTYDRPHINDDTETRQDSLGAGSCGLYDNVSLLQGNCNDEFSAASQWGRQYGSYSEHPWSFHPVFGEINYGRTSSADYHTHRSRAYERRMSRDMPGDSYKPGIRNRKRAMEWENVGVGSSAERMKSSMGLGRDFSRDAAGIPRYYPSEGHHRKRARFTEVPGTGWSVDQKDSNRGWSRNPSKGRARNQGDDHQSEMQIDFPERQKDSARGWSPESNSAGIRDRAGTRGSEDLGSHLSSEQHWGRAREEAHNRCNFTSYLRHTQKQSQNGFIPQDDDKCLRREHCRSGSRSEDSQTSKGRKMKEGYGNGCRRSSGQSWDGCQGLQSSRDSIIHRNYDKESKKSR